MPRPLLLIVPIAPAPLAGASLPLFILYDDDDAGQTQRLPVALELVRREC